MIISATAENNVITVQTELGVSTIDYVPIDLAGMDIETAFITGIAYGIIENSGMLIPVYVPPIALKEENKTVTV
jgi:hypothetical protein